MKAKIGNVMSTFCCLLVAALGATVTHARNDCPDGTLVGGTYDEIVIDRFVDCYVIGVVVTGQVKVVSADQFSMVNSFVSGELRVNNVVSAFLSGNQVFGADVFAQGNTYSTVVGNTVNGGTLRVNDTTCIQQQTVVVSQNQVYNGNLRVNCNEKADVLDNHVSNGDLSCDNNDRVDSDGNRATGGKVDCERSVFE